MRSILLISLYDVEAFGLRSIFGFLRANGQDAHIVFFKQWTWRGPMRFTADELVLLKDEIRAIAPAIIGVSVRSFFFSQAAALTRAVKESFPDIPVVWGGCHPTLMPEECIRHCDGLVVGEGEKPMLELARRMGTPAWFNVANTWLKDGAAVRRNEAGDLNDLDALPETLPDDGNKCFIEGNAPRCGDPLIPRITRGTYVFLCARGCPFNCAYCGNRALAGAQCRAHARFLRWRSPALVVAELKKIKDRFNVRRFSNIDEVFMVDMKWAAEFADRYAAEIGLPFHCQLHPSQITGETLRILDGLGVQTMSIGIESGNERTRVEIYNRRTPDSMLLEKARLLKRHGIHVNYDFIFGNPLEPSGAARDAVELLLRFPRPFGVNMYKLQHLPGTALTKMLLDKGQIRPEDVQGAGPAGAGQFDLASYAPDRGDPEFLYWTNLLFLLATALVVRTRRDVFACAPVPRFVVSFLARRRRFGLVNRLTWLIRKQRVFWSFVGASLSKLK